MSREQTLFDLGAEVRKATRRVSKPRRGRRRSVASSAVQQPIDFDRGDRLALLDALPVESGETRDGKVTVRVSGGTALSVLRAIEAHARTTGQSWASAEYIGEEIRRSERTVRRAIKYLEGLQFLIVHRAKGKSHSCHINWGEISLQVAKSDPGHSPSDPGQFDSDPGQFDANPGHSVRRSVSKRKEKRPPPAPKPDLGSSDRFCDVAEPRASWREVEEVLCGLLGDWRRVLRSVRQSGVGPQHALQIINHYQQLGSRVGPGALYWRLRNAHPTIEPDSGWPVELPRPREPVTKSAEAVRDMTIREGRKKGASDREIQEVLAKRLAFFGHSPEAVEVSV